MPDRPAGFDPAAFRAEVRRAGYRLPGNRIQVTYCTEYCGLSCTCSLGAYYRQSATACCPRQTIPDSCSCLEGCRCSCRDCDCGTEEDEDW